MDKRILTPSLLSPKIVWSRENGSKRKPIIGEEMWREGVFSEDVKGQGDCLQWNGEAWVGLQEHWKEGDWPEPCDLRGSSQRDRMTKGINIYDRSYLKFDSLSNYFTISHKNTYTLINSRTSCHELTAHQPLFSELSAQQWTKQSSCTHWAYIPLRSRRSISRWRGRWWPAQD